MSSEFQPTLFLFGDRAGLGAWEIGHYRQHLRYLTHLESLPQPIVIQDYPIMHVGNNEAQRKVWLRDHESIHAIVRGYANVTSIDLSVVDFENPEQVYEWLQAHALEHQLIDTAFGLS